MRRLFAILVLMALITTTLPTVEQHGSDRPEVTPGPRPRSRRPPAQSTASVPTSMGHPGPRGPTSPSLRAPASSGSRSRCRGGASRRAARVASTGTTWIASSWRVRAGLKILARVDHSPAWSRAIPAENGPPDDPYDYADFVGEMARRYANGSAKGTIHAIQVWNEPNLCREWGGTGVEPIIDRRAAVDYMSLLRQSYKLIKEKDPTKIVVSAGLSPTGTSDGTAIGRHHVPGVAVRQRPGPVLGCDRGARARIRLCARGRAPLESGLPARLVLLPPDRAGP